MIITIMHSVSSVFKRVRIKIRDGHSNFSVTNTSWPAFCYPNSKQCSSQDIEKGLFRGQFLVKVMYCYQSINHSEPFVLTFIFRHSSTFFYPLHQLWKMLIIWMMLQQLQSTANSSSPQPIPMLYPSVASSV